MLVPSLLIQALFLGVPSTRKCLAHPKHSADVFEGGACHVFCFFHSLFSPLWSDNVPLIFVGERVLNLSVCACLHLWL